MIGRRPSGLVETGGELTLKPSSHENVGGAASCFLTLAACTTQRRLAHTLSMFLVRAESTVHRHRFVLVRLAGGINT